jgi:hypothetical protein
MRIYYENLSILRVADQARRTTRPNTPEKTFINYIIFIIRRGKYIKNEAEILRSKPDFAIPFDSLNKYKTARLAF